MPVPVRKETGTVRAVPPQHVLRPFSYDVWDAAIIDHFTQLPVYSIIFILHYLSYDEHGTTNIQATTYPCDHHPCGTIVLIDLLLKDSSASSMSTNAIANNEMESCYEDVSSGSCLCGAVKFTVSNAVTAASSSSSSFSDTNGSSPFLSVAHCYCHMCQKHHGASCSTFAEVRLTDLHWLDDSESFLQDYRSPVNNTVRRFCGTCGSSIVFDSKYNRDDGTTEISLASFDYLAPSHKHDPTAHIFLESKPSWVHLSKDDPIPQYAAYRTTAGATRTTEDSCTATK